MSNFVITDAEIDTMTEKYLTLNTSMGHAAEAAFAVKLMREAFGAERALARKTDADDQEKDFLRVQFDAALEALRKTNGHIPDLFDAVKARVAPTHVRGYDPKRRIIHTNACHAQWILSTRLASLIRSESFALRTVMGANSLKYLVKIDWINKIVDVPTLIKEFKGDPRNTFDAVKALVYAKVWRRRVEIRMAALNDLRETLTAMPSVEDFDDQKFWLGWMRKEVRVEISTGRDWPRFGNILIAHEDPEMSDDERLPLLNSWLPTGDFENMVKKALAHFELENETAIDACHAQHGDEKEANS